MRLPLLERVREFFSLRTPSAQEAAVLRILADGKERFAPQIVDEAGGLLGMGTVYVLLRSMVERGVLEWRHESSSGLGCLPRTKYRLARRAPVGTDDDP